jgi:alcohol dehydrogenase (cytochrome c)
MPRCCVRAGKRLGVVLVLLGACACTAREAVPPPPPEVGYERLLNAEHEPSMWLTHSGSYHGQRFSQAALIDRTTVSRLRPGWKYPLQTSDPVESTPLVVDGTMYVTRPPGDVVALDVRTGQPRWQFSRPVPDTLVLCCGRINRGLAMLRGTLYVGTLDGALVALDAKDGRKRWEVQVADPALGFNISAAPLALKDLVLTGVAVVPLQSATRLVEAVRKALPRSAAALSEAELLRSAQAVVRDKGALAKNGVPESRGHLDAYDAETGKLRWRFHTVPGPGEPGHETWEGDSWWIGGAAPWMTGSYDPALNLVYWGVGNPSLQALGDLRKGDNLYSSSVVALDADTGRRKWHFQFTPHDVYDWDAAQVPVLADLEVSGQKRALLLTANRNGFYYALDRKTGELLAARAYAKQTWAAPTDGRTRPVVRPGVVPTYEGTLIAPNTDGATSWWSPSFSPHTGLFYVTAHDCEEPFLRAKLGPAVQGTASVRSLWPRKVDASGKPDYAGLKSAVRALQATTGELKWQFDLPLRSTAGILTTAGGVLFTGSTRGDFWGLDAHTGEVLWAQTIEGWVHAAPITYLVDGSQRVAIASSTGVFTFELPKP